MEELSTTHPSGEPSTGQQRTESFAEHSPKKPRIGSISLVSVPHSSKTREFSFETVAYPDFQTDSLVDHPKITAAEDIVSPSNALDGSYQLLLTRVHELEERNKQLEQENQTLHVQNNETLQKNQELIAANNKLQQRQLSTQTLHSMIKHITFEQLALKERVHENYNWTIALKEEKALHISLKIEIVELRQHFELAQQAFSNLEASHGQLVEEYQTLQGKYEEAHSRIVALSRTSSVPKQIIQDICTIFDEICRLHAPAYVYSVFLKVLYCRWQLEQIKKGRPYLLETSQEFLQEYTESTEQTPLFLCECYVHGFFILHDSEFFANLYVGEVQLQAFASALLNQIQWKKEILQFQNRQETDDFPMREEAYYPQRYTAMFRAALLRSEVKDQYLNAIAKCVEHYWEIIQNNFEEAILCCTTRWMGLTYELRLREIYTPTNLYWS